MTGSLSSVGVKGEGGDISLGIDELGLIPPGVVFVGVGGADGGRDAGFLEGGELDGEESALGVVGVIGPEAEFVDVGGFAAEEVEFGTACRTVGEGGAGGGQVCQPFVETLGWSA